MSPKDGEVRGSPILYVRTHTQRKEKQLTTADILQNGQRHHGDTVSPTHSPGHVIGGVGSLCSDQLLLQRAVGEGVHWDGDDRRVRVDPKRLRHSIQCLVLNVNLHLHV